VPGRKSEDDQIFIVINKYPPLRQHPKGKNGHVKHAWIIKGSI
jgi:hypothetical protein